MLGCTMPLKKDESLNKRSVREVTWTRSRLQHEMTYCNINEIHIYHYIVTSHGINRHCNSIALHLIKIKRIVRGTWIVVISTSPERCPTATENFNFPLEVIDNNANIFPCDGGSLRRTKDSIPLPLFCPFTTAPPHFGDDTDESDEDDNASWT